jgi:hypothetical protein
MPAPLTPLSVAAAGGAVFADVASKAFKSTTLSTEEMYDIFEEAGGNLVPPADLKGHFAAKNKK